MHLFKQFHKFWFLKVYVFLGIFLLTACVEDVDFNQPTDITLTPVLEASLVFFDIEASSFVINNIETITLTDSVSDIDIFQESIIDDNLERAELFFEIKNTINRTFDVQLLFLNTNNQPERITSIEVQPSPTGAVVITEHEEIFDEISIQELKNTVTIVFVLTLLPSTDGSTLDENSIERLELDSKGTFYFRIEN